MTTIDSVVELIYGKFRENEDTDAQLIAHSKSVTLEDAKHLLSIAQDVAQLETERHNLPALRVVQWSTDNNYAVATYHLPVTRLGRVGIETRYLLIPAGKIKQNLGGSLAWLLIDDHLKFLTERFTTLSQLPPYIIEIADPFGRAIKAVQKVLSQLPPTFLFDIMAAVRQREDGIVAITNVEDELYGELALTLTMLTPVEKRTALTFSIPSFSDLRLRSATPTAMHLSSNDDVIAYRLHFKFDCARPLERPLNLQYPPDIENLRHLLTGDMNANVIREVLLQTASDMFSPSAQPPSISTQPPRQSLPQSAPISPSITPLQTDKDRAIAALMMIKRKQDIQGLNAHRDLLKVTFDLLSDKVKLRDNLVTVLQELDSRFVPFIRVLDLIAYDKRSIINPDLRDNAFIAISTLKSLPKATIEAINGLYNNQAQNEAEAKAYERWRQTTQP